MIVLIGDEEVSIDVETHCPCPIELIGSRATLTHTVTLVQGRRNDFWVGGLKSLYRFLGGPNRLFREFLLEENDLLGEFFKSWGGWSPPRFRRLCPGVLARDEEGTRIGTDDDVIGRNDGIGIPRGIGTESRLIEWSN